jgi:branched-chain amino acid transport system permease protein
MEQIIPSIWGYDALNLGDPWGIDTVTAGGLVFAVKDLWAIGITAVVLLAFFAFFKFSSMGIAMRAAAFDQEAALARGISVRRVFAWSWGIAGAVAALAGVSLGAGPASVTPSLGFIALAAFPALILGGLDSPFGVVIGGVVIGVTQTLTSGYQPEYAAFLGNNFSAVMPYVVMVVILLIRPYGLFGTREVHRL